MYRAFHQALSGQPNRQVVVSRSERVLVIQFSADSFFAVQVICVIAGDTGFRPLSVYCREAEQGDERREKFLLVPHNAVF